MLTSMKAPCVDLIVLYLADLTLNSSGLEKESRYRMILTMLTTSLCGGRTSGRRALKVKWLMNNSYNSYYSYNSSLLMLQVYDTPAHKIVINEDGINSLIIASTQPSDAGQYVCVAKNRGGEDRFTVHLNVVRK